MWCLVEWSRRYREQSTARLLPSAEEWMRSSWCTRSAEWADVGQDALLKRMEAVCGSPALDGALLRLEDSYIQGTHLEPAPVGRGPPADV